MIQEGENGFLIRPGDVGALAGRLKWILEHPHEAKQLGERARKFAQDFFSEDLYLQGYKNLFTQALSIES